MKNALLFIGLVFAHLGFSQTTVEFVLSDFPEGKQMGIRGSAVPLSWDKSLPLKKNGALYSIVLEFPVETEEVEFKFVHPEGDEIKWETNENRVLNLKSESPIVSKNEWNVEQLIDISKLPKLSPEALLADYQYIEKMVLDVHPGTYRYNNESDIQKALTALRSTFQNPLSYGEAYLAINKLTAQLKCSHTMSGIYNQKAIINSLIHRQADKLPFSFTWIEDKMILLENASEQRSLTKGTQIVSINGKSTADIQKEMMDYIPADGSTDHSRKAYLDVNGYSFQYNAFDAFFALLYPFNGNEVTLEVLTPNNAQKEVFTVATLTRKERAEKLAARYPDFPTKDEDLWKLDITEDNIGILSINTFVLYGLGASGIDYKAFFKSAFAQLKAAKVNDLIIDIRQNLGGNDEIAEELFTYFNIDKDAPALDQIGKSRYLKFPEMLKPHIKTWGDNPWFYKLEPDEVDEENGYYIFNDDFEEQKLKRKKNAFKGNVYLLTSPLNVSLAYYCAANFKLKKVGQIVGQETGGNQRDFNGGQIVFLYLPNSGIEVEFPVVGAFTTQPRPDKGIVPDYEVKPTVKDIVDGVDTELSFTLAMIRK
ncbi:MAG: S41 family peptidase [Bacteroidota bacterium]